MVLMRLAINWKTAPSPVKQLLLSSLDTPKEER